MTDIEWGAEIAVNGVRPEWLRGNDVIAVTNKHGTYWSNGEAKAQDCCNWPPQTHIRLPATHPYYLATSRGFTYWPGGDSAPEGWTCDEVLTRSGSIFEWPAGVRWGHEGLDGDIIGYRKRTDQPAPAIAPELVERMVALIRGLARDQWISGYISECRAILAELEPDPDLTLAKSIVGDAEAIALAIKAARENGRG